MKRCPGWGPVLAERSENPVSEAGLGHTAGNGRRALLQLLLRVGRLLWGCPRAHLHCCCRCIAAAAAEHGPAALPGAVLGSLARGHGCSLAAAAAARGLGVQQPVGSAARGGRGRAAGSQPVLRVLRWEQGLN